MASQSGYAGDQTGVLLNKSRPVFRHISSYELLADALIVLRTGMFRPQIRGSSAWRQFYLSFDISSFQP